ncbi:MAG: formate dehydrogenase accessory sulfurtransferase FdhD [Xanthomonadales bacterium]|nr:formate dehydrogenase accessory sulfurtransferase FdhD [Xanthomonadales bacterium]
MLSIQRLRDGALLACEDRLAVEAALELRLTHPALGTAPVAVATTLRTPGEDSDLAIGHLYAEGLIESRADVLGVHPCKGPVQALRVDLHIDARVPDLKSLRRHGTLSSACGACGKVAADALRAEAVGARVRGSARLAATSLCALPDRLRSAQTAFATTGGVHGVGLFGYDGELLALREDVGRHNALDKLIGHALQQGGLPWTDHALLWSGRASFELLQKAARAGASLVAAIGAPSSLAVEVAQRAGITLVGFLSPQGFNVYAGAERVVPEGSA